MILGQLTLDNFSVYAGAQTIDLTPSCTDRPIVLIGGLNGAGKTSLLTAVRLALFGKRMVQLNQGSGSYVRFLRGLVHDKSNGHTSVELEFCTYTLGERDTFRIRRSWALASGERIHENSLTAWKNGREDHVLSAAWDDFIDTLMPASIAHLFFFDGEKVAELANTEGARTLLSTGVRSLLGIDLLARIQDDLADLINRKLKSFKDDDISRKLSSLESDLGNLESHRAELLKEIDSAEIQRNGQAQILAKVEARFKETGAHLFGQRKDLEEECRVARDEFGKINALLVELAAGPLPFALIPDLLQQVRAQDQREQAAAAASVVLSVLEDRDQRTLAMLGDAESEVQTRLANFLLEDRRRRAETTKAEQLLNLTPEGRHKLEDLDEILAGECSQAQELLNHRAQAETQLQDAERRLGMVPPQEAVQEIIKEREKHLREMEKHAQKLEALWRKLEQCEGAIAFRHIEQERAFKRLSSRKSEDSTDARVILYAQKARGRAEAFSQRVLSHSLAELGEQILESLKQLLRKEKFVCKVAIDPHDFTLSLFGEQGQPIPLDRLSAGERQLVIIAILWGLGRASGRPLPLIIDTPLGRLDTKHRDNLLDYYLPDASHQTILLATDAEISKADEARLAPFLGGSYVLVHDDAAKRTVIKPGYLWS